MDKQILDYIAKVAEEMFSYWPVSAEVKVTEEAGFVRVNLVTNKDYLFVQPSADPLMAIQHIMRLMVKNKFPGEMIHLSVNIGDFHERQKNALIELTESAVQRVKRDGAPVYLPPMSSFERRLVHLHLANAEGIASESIGSEPNRRLVIKSTS